jgi:hypothetical protein
MARCGRTSTVPRWQHSEERQNTSGGNHRSSGKCYSKFVPSDALATCVRDRYTIGPVGGGGIP